MPSDTETDEIVSDKPFIAAESPAFSTMPPKRKRGGVRKDGAPIGSLSELTKDVPTPKYTSFYSDHDNPTQKTRAAWTWWKGLKPAQRDLLDAHVYRSWPVLLDPEESEHKYIDKIIGSEPIQNDQDFVDRWGAGDYVLYLNVNPASGKRRTVFIAYVKCIHDFRKFTPTDRRIDDLANLSIADPANAAYVAWLKSQGKIQDHAKEKEDEMAQSALVDKLLDQNKDLVDKAIADAKEKRADADTPDPVTGEAEAVKLVAAGAAKAQELIITSFERILATNGTGDPNAATNMGIEIAKLLVSAQSPGNERVEEMRLKYENEREKREEERRQREADNHRHDMESLRGEIRELRGGVGSAVITNGGTESLVESITKRVIDQIDLDTPKKAIPWWFDKDLIAPFAPIINSVVGRLLMPPQPASPPQGPPLHQNMQQQPQPQAQQIQSPQQQQPGPQAVPPPQQQQPNAQQVAIVEILTAIAGPIVSSLSNGEGGDDFADAFISEHGQRGYRLISGFSASEITDTLYGFPLTAGNMTQFPREKVLKFTEEFKSFDPIAYDKKMEERERNV